MFGDISPKLPGVKNINTAANITANLPGAWIAYTPTWTAASVNPAIGNGVLSGWYQVFGKTIMVRITLTIGSTTTLGTGTYSWALPFTASPNFQVKTICGSGYIENSGIAGFQCFPRIDTTTLVQCEAPNTTTDTRLADVGPPTAGPVNHPIPFAANDFVRFQFTYESV